MDSIVTFLWNDGFRDYSTEHVNILAKQAEDCVSLQYQFVCVYDQVNPEGLDTNRIKAIPLPESAKWTRNLSNPISNRLPSSYRRMWAFSEEAKILGDRILLLDLDCLIVSDLKPLFEYSNADFVGWNPRIEFPGKKCKEPKRIGGGTWLLRTGTNTHIWDKLSESGIRKAKKSGWKGSDQAWLSYNFADSCVCWPQSMGIYNNQETRLWKDNMPEDAKIIHFNGKEKPWHKKAMERRKWFNGI